MHLSINFCGYPFFRQNVLKFINFMMEFQKVLRKIKTTIQLGVYQTKLVLKWNKTDEI